MHRGTVRAAASVVLLLSVAGCGGDEPAGTDGPVEPSSTAGSAPSAASSPAPTRSRTQSTSAAPAVPQGDLDSRLIAAARDNDVQRARRLIEQGADVDARDDNGENAYLIATSEGHYELLELTLRSGADPLARDRYDGTGVIRAAERGHWRIVGRLVQEGLPVDHVNNLGWTALHEAIVLGDGSERYVDTVRVLVAAGADVLIRSRRDDTPPEQQARSRGYDEIARTVAAAAAEEMAPAPARPGRRLLDAAARGDADEVALLLRVGADTRARDGQGRTSLDLAERGGHADATQVLVAMGASRS